MIIPKDIRGNLEWRAEVIEKASKDPELAGLIREICFRDIQFFVNGFCWLFNPFDSIKHPPFITFEYQDDTFVKLNDAIENGKNVFIDKSRDMGATWMVDITYLWRWLSKPGEQFRLGSRKEDYVDKSGDMSTHFEKLRYTLDRLPAWLKPVGFDKRKHSTYMRLINPENGNAIIGEATNKDFARGGREKSILFDEFQSWEMAEEAWTAASDASRCKIALGTPDGAGNKFAELSRTDEVKTKIRLWWYMHPHKAVTSPEHLKKVKDGKVWSKRSKGQVELAPDQSTAPSGCYVDTNGKIRSEWYDKQDEERSSDDMAANVDIDYLTTGRPLFDTATCERMLREAGQPKFVGNLIWKVRPVFSDAGEVINSDQLEAEFVPNVNGLYRIWHEPKENTWDNGFVIGADTAEGLEQGDYDSAYCLCRVGELPRVSASLHGHLPMHEYAEELAKFGVYYNRAYVNVERNNHGHGVILQLVRLYKKLWHKDVFSKGYASVTDQIGFSTTSLSKPAILGELGKHISLTEFKCDDEGFWKETLTFVEDDGKMEAQGKSKGQRCYDDRVMSMAITLWTHKNMPLPSPPRPKYDVARWRQRQMNRETRLVGWTV